MYIILIIVCLTLLLKPFRYWTRFQTWRWQRSLALQKHIAVFQEISEDINGFALSKQARIQCDALEYVYGEIDYMSFVALLSLTKPDSNTVFYDLGSGTGKAVFACAMVFQVKKSCGIELFTELHTAALKQQKRLVQCPGYTNISHRIHFIENNFLSTNFHDATLIFINATGYFGETWSALNHQLDQLTTCQTIITTTKPLSSCLYKVTKITLVQMSWGVVKAYIHMRLSRPENQYILG